MVKADKTEPLVMILNDWALRWPSSRWGERNARTYADILSQYRPSIVTKALDAAAATNYDPNRIPSAQTVYQHARQLAGRDEKPPPPIVDYNPTLPPDNPFMRLAEEFRAESARLGLDPSKPSPKHIAKKRIAQVMELLSENWHFETTRNEGERWQDPNG